MNQNKEVFEQIAKSGKSLLQLYLELKQERDTLAVELACKSLGIPRG